MMVKMLLAFVSRAFQPAAALRCGFPLPKNHRMFAAHATQHRDNGGKGGDGTRVFVSGLPEKAQWKDLKDHFKVCG